MRIIGFLFVYLFSLADLGAQVKDRYLELTHDTLSAEMVGTNFLRTTFSSAPQAFFMNKDCMDDCKAWEIEQLDDIYRFKAIEGHRLFHYSTDRLSVKTVEAPADRELYDLLSNLFRRALLLAEPGLRAPPVHQRPLPHPLRPALRAGGEPLRPVRAPHRRGRPRRLQLVPEL